MDLYVLEPTFETVGIVEDYSSLIWTERYWDVGSFELYVPATAANIALLTKERLLVQVPAPPGSNDAMVIEVSELDDDAGTIKITGRSITSYLDRRIVTPDTDTLSHPELWKAYDLITWYVSVYCISFANGGAALIADAIPTLSNESGIISGTSSVEYSDRKGPVLNCVRDVADLANLGFYIKLLWDPATPTVPANLEFRVRKGLNRTSDQTTNDQVVFRSDVETLMGGKALVSMTEYKNFAIVYSQNWTYSYRVPAPGTSINVAGLDKRVMIVDANDIEKKSTDTVASHNKKLKQRGYEELAKNAKVVLFDGQISPDSTSQFGIHYNMGDVVERSDGAENKQVSRVTEYIWSYSSTGPAQYPTFSETKSAETGAD